VEFELGLINVLIDVGAKSINNMQRSTAFLLGAL